MLYATDDEKRSLQQRPSTDTTRVVLVCSGKGCPRRTVPIDIYNTYVNDAAFRNPKPLQAAAHGSVLQMSQHAEERRCR